MAKSKSKPSASRAGAGGRSPVSKRKCSGAGAIEKACQECGHFYVYQLADPRTDEVFYVGKGKGLRYKSHVRAVKRGKADNGAKCLRIKEILESGNEVVEEIVADGLSEESAFRLERQMIQALRDTPALTNIASGRVTSAESYKARAAILLKQTKPFDAWECDVSGPWRAAIIHLFGDLRAFYDWYVAAIKREIEAPSRMEISL